MKISIDDIELFSLSDTQKKVIKNDILEDVFEDDMKRRVQHSLMDKYNQCFKRLKQEWEPKLKKSGLQSIPLDDEEFAKLVFSREDYKDRIDREKN